MFNLFNKKKENINDIVRDVNDNYVSYHYSNSSFPKEHRNKNVYIKEWKKFNGDYVSKDEIVGELSFNDNSFTVINLLSNANGIIEIFKASHKIYDTKEFLKEDDIVFVIHKDSIEEKRNELRNKRFENTPLIINDDFSKSKTIKWESVAGVKKRSQFDLTICDSITLKNNRLFFSFNNIENRDFILFKSAIKEFKLAIGTKVSFLFSNEDIIKFEIINKPYKYSNSYDWGNIYECKVPITITELNLFENYDLIKWQIEYADNEIKVIESIESEDTKFIIRKFTKEYKEIVKYEALDYQPLNEREILSTSETDDKCHVYLMIDHTNNYYKIGISNKPKYREKTLQSEKPTIELIINKRFPNRKIANSFEQALHQAYSEKRIRGEWFSLDFNDVEDIKEALK
jgi:hypothetical protein